MYQVLARKWRPRSFDELVGQKHVSRTLENAIKSERLAHAYIFAGLRGTGKTTVARIFAKCLNCEKGPTPTPCGECTPCREIADSSALDVMELDAASRTSVDNIRELQEVISYSPVRDRYRVLIIDEAHMLSKAAFNALLKTLEEPPPNVIFILATTEQQKILTTILSRCQVFEFRRLGTREVADLLERICKEESIEISADSLERIARAGEGSVRDSLSVLEQVLAFSGSTVDDDEVLGVLGAVKAGVLTAMLQGLADRDAGVMLTVLDSLVDEGQDLLHFWSELISALRDVLFLRSVPDRFELLSRSPEEARGLQQATSELSVEDLVRAFQVLAELEPMLKMSGQPRFMFEAALIRLASLGAVRPIEELLAGFDDPGKLASRAATPQKKNLTSPGPVAVTGRGGSDLAARIVAATNDARPMVGAMLEHAARVVTDGDRLVIEFAAGGDALARQLKREANLKALRKLASDAAGKPMQIVVELGSEPDAVQAKPTGGESEARAERPSPDVSTRSRAADSPRAPQSPDGGPDGPDGPAQERIDGGDSNLVGRAQQEPGVKKLIREFGAQVVEFRPE